MRDTLPKKAREVECWILNHASLKSKSIGTHWTSLVKIKNRAWYFDSFGRLPPPLEVERYLGKKVKISYNYHQYQNYDSPTCGKLCLEFLFDFWANRKRG